VQQAKQIKELHHAELAHSTQAKEHKQCSRQSWEQLCFNFYCRRYPGEAGRSAELAARPMPAL